MNQLTPHPKYSKKMLCEIMNISDSHFQREMNVLDCDPEFKRLFPYYKRTCRRLSKNLFYYILNELGFGEEEKTDTRTLEIKRNFGSTGIL